MSKEQNDKERITIYIDRGIHADAKALAKEMNMSLSAMTRLLYVVALSFRQLGKGIEYERTRLQAQYPDGMPEEMSAAAVQEFMGSLERVLQKWVTYSVGMLDAAGIPGRETTGPVDMPSIQDTFRQAIGGLDELKHLSAMLDEEHPKEKTK